MSKHAARSRPLRKLSLESCHHQSVILESRAALLCVYIYTENLENKMVQMAVGSFIKSKNREESYAADNCPGAAYNLKMEKMKTPGH